MNENEKTLQDRLIGAPRRVEEVRKVLNQLYSQAPKKLSSQFATSLDQCGDFLYKICTALGEVIANGNIQEAAIAADSAAEMAEKIALDTVRAFADIRREEADDFDSHELPKIHANTKDLVLLKQDIDERFEAAATLHENDDMRAFEGLVTCCKDYDRYLQEGGALQRGSMSITKRERRRERIMITSLIIAIIALIIALIGRDQIFILLK